MKNIIFFFGMISFLISCAGEVISRNNHGMRPRDYPREQFDGVKKKVALLTFFNEAPIGGQDLGVIATEELRMELSRAGQFIIAPMAAKLFGDSKEIYAGGGIKLVQLSRQARGQGINFVIFGRIVESRVREKTDEIGLVRETKAYTESSVELRIFDVNANKEIFTDILKGYADDSSYRFFNSDREDLLSYRRDLSRYGVRIAVRRAIPKLIELASKLDWVGRVAKIQGNRIYINAGRESGLQLSDILKVMTEGQEIYDPDTGAMIGVTKGEIKGTLEVIDYFGNDGAIAILHSGGSVVEGDFVQLY